MPSRKEARGRCKEGRRHGVQRVRNPFCSSANSSRLDRRVDLATRGASAGTALVREAPTARGKPHRVVGRAAQKGRPCRQVLLALREQSHGAKGEDDEGDAAPRLF